MKQNLHNVNVSGKAASGDTVAAEEFLNLFSEIAEEGGYLSEHVFNVNVTGLFWKNMLTAPTLQKKKISVWF
jgi:hypothetical protein